MRTAGHCERRRRRGRAHRRRPRRAQRRAGRQRRARGGDQSAGVRRVDPGAARRRRTRNRCPALRSGRVHAGVPRRVPARCTGRTDGGRMNARAQVVAAPIEATSTRIRWGFAEWFIISQTALPALLILPGMQAFRLPIRVSAFVLPLGAFVKWHLDSETAIRPSRAQSWVFAILLLLTVMVFHPSTSSFKGGVAHVAVYFAVMTPLFWAPSYVRTPEHLARLLWILLMCCGANAVVGVLQ